MPAALSNKGLITVDERFMPQKSILGALFDQTARNHAAAQALEELEALKNAEQSPQQTPVTGDRGDYELFDVTTPVAPTDALAWVGSTGMWMTEHPAKAVRDSARDPDGTETITISFTIFFFIGVIGGIAALTLSGAIPLDEPADLSMIIVLVILVTASLTISLGLGWLLKTLRVRHLTTKEQAAADEFAAHRMDWVPPAPPSGWRWAYEERRAFRSRPRHDTVPSDRVWYEPTIGLEHEADGTRLTVTIPVHGHDREAENTIMIRAVVQSMLELWETSRGLRDLAATGFDPTEHAPRIEAGTWRIGEAITSIPTQGTSEQKMWACVAQAWWHHHGQQACKQIRRDKAQHHQREERRQHLAASGEGELLTEAAQHALARGHRGGPHV